MNLISIAVVTGGLLVFSLIIGRFQGSDVMPALVFMVFGFLVGSGGTAIANMDPGHGAIHFIAEFTLILVLFTHASRIELSRLRQDHNIPVRMLIIGLPVCTAHPGKIRRGTR